MLYSYKLSLFLTTVLSKSELSALMCALNIPKEKQETILIGNSQASIFEGGFDNVNRSVFGQLVSMYPESYIDNICYFKFNDVCFVFDKETEAQLTEIHYDVLKTLALNVVFSNPVYCELDEENKLIID